MTNRAVKTGRLLLKTSHAKIFAQVQEWQPPLHRVYRRGEGVDKDDVELGS